MVQRQQCNNAKGSISEIEASKKKSTEWEQARPYNHIPKVGLMNFVGHMLPGGRYHKMEFPDIMLDLRIRNGPLYRLAGVVGKSEQAGNL